MLVRMKCRYRFGRNIDGPTDLEILRVLELRLDFVSSSHHGSTGQWRRRLLGSRNVVFALLKEAEEDWHVDDEED